jgi:hypothetical protein
MSEPKTLIGKNGVLFLTNDGSEELKIHCNNLVKVHDITLSRYQFKNYMIFIYPDKSFVYRKDLPEPYYAQYRPGLEIYKNKFKDNLYDLYEVLQSETDIYYKTDTHINTKGNYIVYQHFIKVLNSRLNLNITPKILELKSKQCELTPLCLGIGDLTWDSNRGNQIIEDPIDTFYYHENYNGFYCTYIIKNDNSIRFLDEQFIDQTKSLEGEVASWHIISKYKIYVKNENKAPLKVVIFYDSFLAHYLPLYFDLFNEVYFIKAEYSNELINLINPDYVFEFRVERFLS